VSNVCSADYAAIVKAYTNRNGELSYELLNKALIQAPMKIRSWPR